MPEHATSAALVAEAKELGGRVNSDRVKVEYQLDPALPSVQSDRGLISEALSNLITNAEQAMVDGGGLTLSSSLQGSSVEVTVADSGPGIAPEERARIYGAFRP